MWCSSTGVYGTWSGPSTASEPSGAGGQYARYGWPSSSVRKREQSVSVSDTVCRRAVLSSAWSSGPSISRQDPVL